MFIFLQVWYIIIYKLYAEMIFLVDQFIKNLIECLDYENANRIRIYNEPQLDIPFLTAALQQHLSNKKYSSFLEDLSKYNYSIF